MTYQKQKLLKLADYLETVPPKNFDMGVWGLRKRSTQKCASTACALGWGTNIWPDELKLVPDSDDKNMASVIHVRTGAKNFSAAREFFGLGYGAANDLFGIVWDRLDETPKQVATRIRSFVRNND